MKPRYRVSVCKGLDCRARGSDGVFTAAQGELARSGLGTQCKLDRGGCYGLCQLGPNVVVRPDDGKPSDPFSRENYRLLGTPGEVHYGAMTPEKITEVVLKHVGRGEPVLDLRGARAVVSSAEG